MAASDGAVDVDIERLVPGQSIRIRYSNVSKRPLTIRDDPDAYYLTVKAGEDWVKLEGDGNPPIIHDIGVPDLEAGQSKTVEYNLQRYRTRLNAQDQYQLIIIYSYADHDLSTGPLIEYRLEIPFAHSGE